ncbi:MAG: glycosyltransferase [Chthoniobacterales bacterium]|nr:glycosyltransferase [Chthoniobacterales bacterium]
MNNELSDLPWTGERYVPQLRGDIALEHLHRYALASEIVKGKRVLDIASGEGYGSEMLSRTAASVVGVDIDSGTIEHAQKKYRKENLFFKKGRCEQIPLLDHSVDVVVSFETIEHLDDHQKMLSEIKRVLTPGGILIVSTPDKHEYTEVPKHHNQFHVNELYRNEFESLLGAYFKNQKILGQRITYGSNILDTEGPNYFGRIYEANKLLAEAGTSKQPFHPIYLIAICSDSELPQIDSTLCEQLLHETEGYRSMSDQLAQKEILLNEQKIILSQQNIDIQKKDALLAEQENLINQKSKLIHEQENQLEIKVKELLQQEKLMEQQKGLVLEKEHQLQSTNQELVQKENLLKEQEFMIAEQKWKLQEKESQLAEKEKIIEQKNAPIIKKIYQFIKGSRLNVIMENKKNFFYNLILPVLANYRKRRNEILNRQHKNYQLKIGCALTKANSSQLKILFINHSTPTPDRDGGSIDIYKKMIALKEMGHIIVFIPADLKYKEGYSEELMKHGIVCLHREDIESVEQYLQLEGNQFDIIFLYRIYWAEYFFQLIKNFELKAKVIFCPVDLHYLREAREGELSRFRKHICSSEQTKLKEIGLMKKVDLSIVLSEKEEHLIRQEAPLANVVTMPFIRDIPGKKNNFKERNGLLFIGSFDHRPNVDAVTYFAEKVWPLILQKNPNITLTIIGSNPSKKVLSLNNKNGINVKGYVHNLEEDFEKAKLSIVPLRFGAGIKGKIATSLSFGVPCVSTEVGVEGMGLTNGVNILIAKDDYDFAEKVIALYLNEETWNNISKNSLKYATEAYSMDVGKEKLEKIITSLKNNRLRFEDHLQQEIKNKKDEKLSMLIELCSFDKGGLQQVVLDSAIEFKNRGHYPIIITSGVIGHLGEKARQAGIEVVKISSNNPIRLQQLIDQHNPAISFSHFSSDGYRLYQKNKIPNITFIHNVYAILSPDQRNEFIANDKYVNKYISVSDKAAEYAASNLGISSDKIVTIPNGLKIEEDFNNKNGISEYTREDFNLNNNDYVFINPASYNLHKGHYLLASALKRVINKHENVKVLCLGNEVYLPHLKELKQHLKKQRLENNFLMPGYFANIKDIFKFSDAFILPSFIEGWSIAMNEAMYYGKPMICTDTGGASAVIEENDIGILIPNEYGDSKFLSCNLLNDLAYSPRDYKTTELLAQAMCNFVENKKQWTKSGLLGRSKIIKCYNYNLVIEKYLTVVEQVLNRKNGNIHFD